MKSIANHISQLLCDNKFISSDDIDLCKYALENLFLSLIEILFIIALSLFMGNTLCTILFFTSFIPLRRYTGGYHADTKFGCFLTLIVVYVGFSLVIKYMSLKYYTLFKVVTLFTLWITVLKYAPIVHRNKRASEKQRMYYRKKSIVLSFLLSVLTVMSCLIYSHSKYWLAISLGQLVVSLSMIATVLNDFFEKGGNKNEEV